jgi:flavin-dependent dehydrogenase
VGDAATEHGGGSQLFVDVHRVVVAGDAGEHQDVRFGHGAGIHRALADGQLLELVTVELFEIGV